MPTAVQYAEDCLAGLNSEVLRQTVVIRTEDLSGSFVGEVIEHIADQLPPRNLRIKVIRCSADNAAAVSTTGETCSARLRGSAPVLVLETICERVDLVIVPVAKPWEDF